MLSARFEKPAETLKNFKEIFGVPEIFDFCEIHREAKR